AWSPFTVTVTALDAAGATVTAYDGSVSLSDLTGTAVPGTLALFRSGVWTGTVEIRNAHAADVLKVVDALGNAGASAPFPVAPCPAAAIRIETPPRIVTAGQCSGASQPLTVALLDAFGAPTQATASVALSAALAPSAPLEFFSDDLCARPTSQPTFSAGQQAVTVWFRATQVGVATLQLSAASLPPASQLLTVYGVGELPIRSPPAAVLTATPAVTWVGQQVAFDASGSSDYQTASDALEVSWDLEGTATGAPPWTAWTRAPKTASHAFATAGTYTARVAVRDADGDVGFASVTVVVRASSTDKLCLVNTDSDVDDGPAVVTTCADASLGGDGLLSLREALRVAPTGGTVGFATPLTVHAASALTAYTQLEIVGYGVVLDAPALEVSATTATAPFRILGLELSRATGEAVVTVFNGTRAIFEDVRLRGARIADNGTLTLQRVRMEACPGSCVTTNDTSGQDVFTVRHSIFSGAGGGVGLEIAQCARHKLALVAQSSVFTGLAEAIRVDAACNGQTTIVHNTFERNGTGITYNATGDTITDELHDNVFSNQLIAAASGCERPTFGPRDHHLLWQNASTGCLSVTDAGVMTADPRYVLPTHGDYRLQPASPAVDSALDLSLNLIPAFPAPAALRYLGAGPDRGGLESY
ncbi:MAG: PKD domain-containing protein, partial [Anaeromyxobacteraceae bacterium]